MLYYMEVHFGKIVRLMYYYINIEVEARRATRKATAESNVLNQHSFCVWPEPNGDSNVLRCNCSLSAARFKMSNTAHMRCISAGGDADVELSR